MDVAAARLLDEIATGATVSPIEVDIEGWWCKVAPDLPFRRCNTVMPSLRATADRSRFDNTLETVRSWYHDRGRRLIVQVSSADPDHDMLDDCLGAHGLDVEAPVHMLVNDLGQTGPWADPATPDGLGVDVVARIDASWAASYGAVHGGSESERRRTEAYGRMLAAHGDRAIGASAVVDGRIAGAGYGVLDRGWVGIFGMGTAAEHRRRGVATRVLAALVAAAAERGATRAYLQVETDNHAAIDLYEGLGFVRHHGYHYRSEGSDPSLGC